MEKQLFSSEDVITIEQFVTMIIKSINVNVELTNEGCQGEYVGCMDYAFRQGIIEDYEMVNRVNPIERLTAARIVHKVLLKEFGEKDEKNWSAAEKLNDLYICHTCVIHIAQIYVKGIMSERSNNLFDVKGSLTYGEAAVIVTKVLDKKQRNPQIEIGKIKSINLYPAEAKELMLNDSKSILVDVRTIEEYKAGHIDGGICIPISDILNNPFCVCGNKNTPIIFYCKLGYKSSVAAQALIDAGYKRIYTIPGVGQYDYSLIT